MLCSKEKNKKTLLSIQSPWFIYDESSFLGSNSFSIQDAIPKGVEICNPIQTTWFAHRTWEMQVVSQCIFGFTLNIVNKPSVTLN